MVVLVGTETPDFSNLYIVISQHPVQTEYEKFKRTNNTNVAHAVNDLNIPAFGFGQNVDAGNG